VHVFRLRETRHDSFSREALGKRPLGKSRRMEDNIKMDLRKIVCADRRWMDLPQDRVQCRALVLATFNLRVLLLQCCVGKKRIHIFWPGCGFRNIQKAEGLAPIYRLIDTYNSQFNT
jgi:hypothetical protein